MSEYKKFVAESGYVELSEMLLKAYVSEGDHQFHSEYNFIDEWIEMPGASTLLIEGGPQSGKKVLLCGYIEHLLRKKPNYICLYEFAAVSPDYANALYKIMSSLRNVLNIEQKVELNDEKLRRYFKYWLDIASDKIMQESFCSTESKKQCIVIVLEGLQSFVDSNKQPVQPFFWLPQIVPENIRLILSCTSKTNAAVEIKTLPKLKTLQFCLQPDKVTQLLSKLSPCVVAQKHRFNLLELKCLDHFYRNRNSLNVESGDFGSILINYIGLVTTASLTSEHIMMLLVLLSSSLKGLTLTEMILAIQTDATDIEIFTVAFKPLLLVEGDYRLICSKNIKKVLQARLDPKRQQIRSCHAILAKVLKRQPISLRRLQEQIHHLECSENFIELKQLLSRIENFLMLYNPLTKNLICACWSRLQNQLQCDPVFQYNKAVESFLNHYYPKEQDIYKIIFQLSLFFKEYAEFETAKLPDFRHPLIRGDPEYLEKISILGELRAMKMIEENPPKPVENKKSTEGSSANEKYIQAPPPASTTTSIAAEQVSPIEDINVTIRSNQLKFKEHYMSKMEEYLKEYYVPEKKRLNKEEDARIIKDDSDQDDEFRDIEGASDLQKSKQSLFLKPYTEFQQESYHRNGGQLQNYYYKQWLWLQFPWIGQSLNSDYSQMVSRCISSSTKFMSVAQEFKLVKQASKIAKIAKENKSQIYEHKKIELFPMRLDKQPNTSRKSYDNDTSQTMETSRVNIAKYKLNISKIDQQINMEMSKVKRVASKGSFNLEYQQENSPSLLNSLKVSKVMGENPLGESQAFLTECAAGQPLLRNDLPCADSVLLMDTQRAMKKLNEIKHMNEQLTAKISQLKKTCIMLENREEDSSEVTNTKAKMEKLNQQKLKIQKNFATQQQLKAKLESIIKVCDINKKHGSQSEHLSQFLNSIKQMIDVQEIQATGFKKQSSKKIDELRKNYRNLLEQRKSLQNQIATSNSRKVSIERTRRDTEKSSPSRAEEVKREFLGQQSTVRETPKTFSPADELESVLDQEFGISWHNQGKNQAILEEFRRKVDKLNELQMTNAEMGYELEEKKAELSSLSRTDAVRRHQDKFDKGLHDRHQAIICTQQLQKLKRRNEFLKECIAKVK